MFKVGEIVICVDKNVNFAGNDDITRGLTIGNKYRVESMNNQGLYSIVYLINDHGILGNYYNYRFIELTEHRKQKINSLS